MRKIILIVVLIIVMIVSLLSVLKGMNAPFKVYSYSEIEEKNTETTRKLNELARLKATDYLAEESALKKSVTDYEEINNRYEMVAGTKTEEEKNLALAGEEYDLEFLQITLGKHATDNKVDLSMEVSKNKENEKNDYVICDFKFQAVGSYSGITDFIDTISSDDKLKFVPENLKMYSEYREVNTISDNNDTAGTNVNKKQKRLILVAEFYKSNVAVSKDTLLKVENKEVTENK